MFMFNSRNLLQFNKILNSIRKKTFLSLNDFGCLPQVKKLKYNDK